MAAIGNTWASGSWVGGPVWASGSWASGSWVEGPVWEADSWDRWKRYSWGTRGWGESGWLDGSWADIEVSEPDTEPLIRVSRGAGGGHGYIDRPDYEPKKDLRKRKILKDDDELMEIVAMIVSSGILE